MKIHISQKEKKKKTPRDLEIFQERDLEVHLHSCVYQNIMYNFKDMETTQISQVYQSVYVKYV
jgi:hypothetical protein